MTHFLWDVNFLEQEEQGNVFCEVFSLDSFSLFALGLYRFRGLAKVLPGLERRVDIVLSGGRSDIRSSLGSTTRVGEFVGKSGSLV